MPSINEQNRTSLTNEQLFADVALSDFPQPNPSLPPESYIDTLRATYNDIAQVAIVNGLWDLAGLTGFDTCPHYIVGDEAERINDSLDMMRLGYQAFAVDKGVRAGNLLLRYARGAIEPADMPAELVFIDPLVVPVRAPRNGTKEYEQFTQLIHGTLGLSCDETNEEIMKMLDQFRRNVFTYTPGELFVSYWKIAGALPDASMPDEIGNLIFDVRKQSA